MNDSKINVPIAKPKSKQLNYFGRERGATVTPNRAKLSSGSGVRSHDDEDSNAGQDTRDDLCNRAEDALKHQRSARHTKTDGF